MGGSARLVCRFRRGYLSADPCFVCEVQNVGFGLVPGGVCGTCRGKMFLRPFKVGFVSFSVREEEKKF